MSTTISTSGIIQKQEGTGTGIQKEPTTTTRNEFDEWLNGPQNQNTGGGQNAVNWFSLKEDGQSDTLIFYNNDTEENNRPSLIDREFPDREHPGQMKKSTRAVFTVSRLAEPNTILKYEMSRTAAGVVWPMIKRGFSVFDVKRTGRPGDLKTSYQFIPNVDAQQKIKPQQQKLVAA
jgi:hypothetical protein